jgi:uncharacterized protein (TIGR03437 family)
MTGGIALSWLLPFLAQAQVPAPELMAGRVVSAADYRGGGVAPGEIVVLFPSHAGPPDFAQPQLNYGTVSTSAGATRVFFDGVPAPMVYSVSGQVCAVVPYEVSNKKETQVVIEYQGVRSTPVTLAVVESAPAIFTADLSGKGQAAILNETGCCNSARNPARRGSAVALYATGEGQTTPHGANGNVPVYARAADLPAPRLPVKVTLGGVPAEIDYAGGAPHSIAGLLQVNFRVPANAPLGGAVPLVLTVGSARSVDGVTMAIRSTVQTVLVVDPDPAIRNGLAEFLEGAGYEVFAARDAREAGRLAKDHPADLLIFDLGMPEAAALEMHPQCKIIAMSAASGPDVLRAADLLGAQAVFTKPLDMEAALRRVRELLRVRPKVY